MVSHLHELLLLLFRNRSGSAADLLRALDVEIPEFDVVHAESSDLSELQPAEYRADLVLFLKNDLRKVVTEIEEAKKNVELAVLSAIEHSQSADSQLTARIASAAIVASAGLDAESSRMYFDLILISLLASVPEAIETTMSLLKYEYQSDFARRYFFQGKEEGKAEGKVQGQAEGRVELVLKLLALRFGSLTDAVQSHVRGAQDQQIDVVAERMLTAQTLEEALSPLP